ncbi:starch-binding protein [Flavobacterium sp.]|uniref:starch-binding protein n=1 Tax=Flavobacterium sp. TaxID=239 RepID=UPI00286B6BB1|nr:starch-binding protein [Flavobacterium sp.]
MKAKLSLQKKVFMMLCFCAALFSKMNAQSSANVNDIMLQAFGWDVHTQASVSSEGGLYNYLKNRTSGYATAGFNVIWLPPPSKSTGGVGYIPTELFNFSQTVYGSEAQLRALLTAFNTSTPRIHPMADIVVNHRGGTTNWTDFTNPTWDCHSITSNDEANFVAITGVRPCGTPDTGEDFNGARDLDHTNLQVQNGVKEYLTRLKALGFDSWRWDVAKGFSAGYFGDYINASSPYASVGEYWDGNTATLKSWINGTGNRSAAFDFSLYYNALQPAINNGNYAALSGNPGLAGQFGYADKAVTFIDNHDTFVKPGSFVTSDNIMKGYAYILTHPGIPCVFFPHYYGGTYRKDGVTVSYTANQTAIDKLMAIRKTNGINAYSAVVVSNASSFYSATIDNKVVVKIGPGMWNPGTGWVLKTSGTDYAVWEREVIADVPSLTIAPVGGSFVAGAIVNAVLTANNSASTIYYTVDGSTPTTASASAVGTKSLTITSTTTLKAFVRNTVGVSSAIRTEVYTFSSPTTFTVYFKKPSNWNSAIKIYYWNTTGTTPAVAWPGVAMTLDCGSWYKFTFPSTVSASNLIFNDGTLQTADLTATAGIRYYDAAWLTSEPANRCPTAMTVYFKPPTTWTTTPKIHYWNAVPTGSVANTTWPGITMVPDVNGFYKYTIVGPTSVNIVFNNGNSGTGNQTADLLNKTNGYSYTWGASARMLANEPINTTILYPNPVVDVLQISSESNIYNYKMMNIQGVVLKEGKPIENAIDMSNLSSGLYFLQMTFENGQEEIKQILKK